MESDLIRIKKPTKELLTSLKLVEDESFDSVINRILEIKIEDCLEISSSVNELLNNRLENIRRGKAKSAKQMLDEFDKKMANIERNS